MVDAAFQCDQIKMPQEEVSVTWLDATSTSMTH